jgi:hypothetical protein
MWTVKRLLFLIELLGNIKASIYDCCQKEVISDLKRENQFWSKKIWEPT